MRDGMKGFTLFEVLVSAFVLALALGGMLLANTMIQVANERSYERMVARQDAHQVIEQIRERAASGVFPGNVVNTFQNGQAVAGFSNLSSETVNVTYTDPAADPLDVTVTVNWQERGVRGTQTALRTLVTQR